MNRKVGVVTTVAIVAGLGGCCSDSMMHEEQVGVVLDELHDAASQADENRYFDQFTSDAVFLGTDATERWSIEEFRAYARPHFEAGRGWTYTSTERHVRVSDSCDTAWFDERLTNARLGECRGSGVLVRGGDRWRVSQYNLTIPIPNALADEVVERIRVSKIP